MTTPPGSNDPFDYSNDTVSARLSVDVPTDAAANLQQVTRQAHDLRTTMEATARAQNDFVEYLKQLPTLMQEAATAAERFGLNAAGALGQPAAAGNRRARSGRNDATPTMWDEEAPGGRGTRRVVSLDDAMDDLATRDPRQYGNMVAQHGERVIRRGDSEEALPAPRQRRGSEGAGSGPGRSSSRTGPSQDAQPTDWTQTLSRYQNQGINVAQSIMRDTQAGGNTSVFDMAAHAARGVSSGYRNVQGRMQTRIEGLQSQAAEHTIAGNADEAMAAEGQAARMGSLSSGLGTVAKGAGVVGLAAGAAQAVQAGGQWYQGMAAQGMQRGGGASEGIAFESQVRTMAMNPFISLEQSRKIMQSALNEGYTGKEFDTVTEYMADNLKKMNVDVATSVAVLHENVQKGGQSLGGAQTDVRTAQQLSADPNSKLTAAQSTAAYVANTATAVQAGAAGADASKYGLATAAIGGENQLLKGMGTQMATAATTNPMVEQAIGASVGFKGAPGGALTYALAQPGGAQKAEQAQIDQMIGLAQNFIPMMTVDPTQAATNYMQLLNSMGYKFDLPTTTEILKQIMNGTFKTLPSSAAASVTKSETGGPVHEVKDPGKRYGAAFGEGAKEIGGRISQGWNALFGDEGQYDKSKAAADTAHARGHAEMVMGGSPFSSKWTNTRIDDLVSKYGAEGQITLKGKDGKEMPLDEKALSNQGVMSSLVSGDTQLKLPGGNFSKLQDVAGQQSDTISGGSGGGTIQLSDEARKYFNLTPNDPRSSNAVGNDTGTPGNARNSPPPGTIY